MLQSRFSAPELEAFHQTYQRDGVVHVPGLLTPEWTARLMSALRRARETLTGGGVAAAVDPMRGRTSPAAAPAGFATAEFSQAPGRLTIRWLWRDDPEVRSFFTESGVAPVVGAVIGAQRLQYR